MQTTAIDKLLKDATSIDKQVCDFLQLNEEQYCDMQYQVGIEYLQIWLADSPQCRDILERSQLFWKWWRNLWYVRDDVYLFNMEGYVNNTIRRQLLYSEYHNARELAFVDGIRPPKIVTSILLKNPKKQEVYYA